MDLLDSILSNIILYLEPDMIKKEFRPKIDLSSVNKKELKKYFEMLTGIKQIFLKIHKYETYFLEFYPPENGKIKKYEALEHHIHAYMEDMDILKNKIIAFLGTLKNDLKKIAGNKQEVEKALEFLIAEVGRIFLNVSENRGPHHHIGLKFIDGDIIDAETFDFMLNTDSQLRGMLTSEGISKLEERVEDSFEKARAKWIERAKKNKEQIAGAVNDIIQRIEGFTYQFLKIDKAAINEIMGIKKDLPKS